MGFLEAVRYTLQPVTGQVPIAGFFMPNLSSSVVLFGVVRAVFFTFPNFFRIFSLFCATFEAGYHIGIRGWCICRLIGR